MSILTKLKEDHDKVKEILQEAEDFIDNFPDINEKKEIVLIEQLLSELVPHNKAEEKVFYQALRKKDENSLSPYEGLEEHKLALQVLRGLQKDNLDKSQRTANIKVLKTMLLHHIKEEESTFFAEARKSFNKEELQTLGENFIEEKQKILKSQDF